MRRCINLSLSRCFLQQVHGFKQLAKDFAREVEENDGKVIYVNLIEPGKDWNSSIHYHGKLESLTPP